MALARMRSEFGVPDSLDDARAMRHAYTANNQRRVSEGKPAYSEDEWQAVVERMETPGPPPRDAAPGRTGVARTPAAAVGGAAPIPPAPQMGGLPGNAMGMAAGAANEIARGGGLPYLAKMPQRAGKGITDILSGIGPALAGGVHAGATAVRAGMPGPGRYAAQAELAQSARSAGRAAPEVLKGMMQQTGEVITNPGAAFVRRPTETSLDALMFADAPASLAGIGAKVAARAGKAGTAMKAARLADEASVGAGAKALAQQAERIPFVAEQAKNVREAGLVRDSYSLRSKQAATETETARGALDDLVKGLTQEERERVPMAAMSLSSPVNERPEFIQAVEKYRARAQAEEATSIARGETTPAIHDRRKYQPHRIVAGGEEQLAREAAPRMPTRTKNLEGRIKRLEKETAVAAARGERLPEAEARLAALREERKVASAAGREEVKQTVRGAGARAAEKEAGAYASPLERLTQQIEDASSPEAFGRLTERRATSVRAGQRSSKHAVAADAAEQARIAAAESGQPIVPLMDKIGTARAERNAAAAAARKAERGTDKLIGLNQRLHDKKGRIPALDRLDDDTQAIKTKLWDQPTPAYVPMMGAEEKDPIKRLLGRLKTNMTAQKPGYLKRSTGATFASGDFERDIGKIVAKQDQARIANEKNLRFLDDVTRMPFARPIKTFREVDWDNEVLVAPGAYSRTVSPAVAEMDDALTRAMASGDPSRMADDLAKSRLIKSGAQVDETMQGPFYAIPKGAAKEIEGQLGSRGNAYVRAIFDTPNAFLRWTALTLRPGFYVNNVVGNTALSALSGTTPKRLAWAASSASKAEVPLAVRGSGFAKMEAPHMGGRGALAKGLRGLSDANEVVDDYFRRASFASEVDRIAAKKALLETGKTLEKDMDLAMKIDAIGPEGVLAAVKHVDKFLNDYARQSPFQKNILRRILPFQSFLVHMGKLTARLPIQHPMRTQLVEAIADFGNEFQREQTEAVGLDPERVPSWRSAVLPTGRDGERTFGLGTGGYSPVSGFGATSGAMQSDPSGGAILEQLLGQVGPGIKYPLEVATGKRGGIGAQFTKPGVTQTYGRDEFKDDEGNIVGKPRPSLIDLLRSNSPQVGLLERLLQPKETYDLVGAGYLPAKKDEPRKYGFDEALAAFLGYPLRDYTKDEMQQKQSRKKPRKRKENSR